ncbi:MAG: DUF4386 domain-containing protein [Ardenticatenales bacterium]|nr:DUF4386 domain-containing protein [Ardenticatenales bacterium]
MSTSKKLARILGLAFLLQFITSIVSGLGLQPALVVPGDIPATMANIAAKPWLLQINILVDMATAMGIVFLGVALYIALRAQNQLVALLGLGLYILEATLLAGSRLASFWLLRLSEAYVATGQPAELELLAKVALESTDFVGLTLHVLVFSVGAILFYSLLYQSRIVPRALSLWGLVTLLPILYGVVGASLGYTLPEFLYLPYMPFEFVMGLWILFKGFAERQTEQLQLVPA